uniref:NADH dehydrogenase subunit 4 n=1 Tax=Latreutes anoplonyx TaxID=3061097 RepID=UPI00286CCD01|nr:NADH dehydrogenase subunit 4 [Latreutes anoplonyx]WKF54308.1 NADH dehydrogenase subunit 4 [Latreutes anoplonyx]
MMKFVFMSIFMLMFVKDWMVTQAMMYLISGLFMMVVMSDFHTKMLGYGMGLDGVSYILVFLSFWICGLVVKSSQGVYNSNNNSSLFLTMNLLLMISLLFTFSFNDYLLFYISFESSLIPTLILILGWGYQPERLQSGLYMLFYTLFASLPLLVSLLSLYSMSGTLNFFLQTVYMSGYTFMDYIWYFCLLFAFLVKLPMFGVHFWLPKAHVEAPVGGSMILAGVLLKLGGYGMIRMMYVIAVMNQDFMWFWMSIGLVGGIIISLVCLRQTDAKSMVAYSSVCHMGLVLCGLILMNSWGYAGAVTVMVGHGLCSSGLFCIVNIVYERLGSRNLLVNKGLLNMMPSMGLWWFLLIVGNMAAPPTLNLLGEISLMISVVSWSKVTMLGVAVMGLLSASYSLYLYSASQFGVNNYSMFSFCSGKMREYLVLSLHWIPLNILILKGEILMNLV